MGGDEEREEREAFERNWLALSEEVLSGMADWRAQHPQATLNAIETELDTHLARMRARMLERVAQQSAATTWRQPIGSRQAQEETAPRCPRCGAALQPRGRHRRQLRTSGGQEVALERDYGVCPHCGQGLFPPG